MKVLTIKVSEEKNKLEIKENEIKNLTEKELSSIIGFLVTYQMHNGFQTAEAREKANKIFEEVFCK